MKPTRKTQPPLDDLMEELERILEATEKKPLPDVMQMPVGQALMLHKQLRELFK